MTIVAASGILLAGLAAFTVSPKAAILIALAVPAAPLLILGPAKALLLVVAVLPFDSIASLGPSGAVTLTRLLGTATIGVWLLHILLRRQRLRLGAPGFLILGYIAFAATSMAWTEDPEAAIAQLRTLLQLFLFYLMIANMLTGTQELERALDVLLASTTVVALVVISQFPSAEGFVRATLTAGDEHINPNSLAAMLSLPAIAALTLHRTRSAFSWWRFVAIVPIGVAMIITGSRAGFLMLVTGLLVPVIFRPKFGLRAAAVAILIISTLSMIVPPAYTDRLVARFSNSEQDRLAGRVDIWRVGAAMIRDRPFHGTGFAGFQSAFFRYMPAAQIDPRWAIQNVWGMRGSHNSYLNATAELGVFGAFLFFAALTAHGIGVWNAIHFTARAGDLRASNLTIGILAAFAGLLVFGFSADIILFKPTWLVLGLAQSASLVFQPAPTRNMRRFR